MLEIRAPVCKRQYNLNEFNTIENGFAAEFALAQANLYANIASGVAARNGSFAYFGPGTGTSPLPIMLSYFNTAANYDPSNPARYVAASFTNANLVSSLSRLRPVINGGTGLNDLGFASQSFENNATRRANALANGRAF